MQYNAKNISRGIKGISLTTQQSIYESFTDCVETENISNSLNYKLSTLNDSEAPCTDNMPYHNLSKNVELILTCSSKII